MKVGEIPRACRAHSAPTLTLVQRHNPMDWHSENEASEDFEILAGLCTSYAYAPVTVSIVGSEFMANARRAGQ